MTKTDTSPLDSGFLVETCIACQYVSQNINITATILRFRNRLRVIFIRETTPVTLVWLQKNLTWVFPSFWPHVTTAPGYCVPFVPPCRKPWLYTHMFSPTLLLKKYLSDVHICNVAVLPSFLLYFCLISWNE